MDGLFKIIDDAIDEKKKLIILVKDLLNNINTDESGHFIIYKDNIDTINELKRLVK